MELRVLHTNMLIISDIKPGGWIEVQDFDFELCSQDDTLTDEHELKKWSTNLLQASRQNGRDPQPTALMEQWLTSAGFVNVQRHEFVVPVGYWPKDKRMVRTRLLRRPVPLA
jgi:hypothetical protein